MYVEPGTFRMGYAGQGAKPDEKPVRDVEIKKGYFIDQYEVTNRQYAAFVRETKRPAPSHWADGQLPPGEEDLPVVNVTFEDAKAFAEHVGKRLPSAEEWEYAARGPSSKLYPWGQDWAPGKCNNFEEGKNGPVKVGEYKEGKSWCGTYDQAGNVWEWTKTPVPGSPNDMIIKGGSFAPLEDRPRASLTGRLGKGQAKPNVGFRCAKDIE